MAITMKQAIAAAEKHLAELFPEAAETLRFEEIERHGTSLAITFSMTSSSTFGGEFGLGRVAKVIAVDSETGDLISVKQRAA